MSDTVQGSRSDLTIGPIKITGFPYPEYDKVKLRLEYRKLKKVAQKRKLEKMIDSVDEFINAMSNSEMRIMFRLHHIDGLTWYQVAMQMNTLFPKKRIKYTDDNCKQKYKRYLDKIM